MNLNPLAEVVWTALCEVLARAPPPPELTVSEWADQFRVLSSEASAEPGQWRTGRVPYQRGMMDAVNDSANELIVIKTSSQVGKTELILNMLGYYAHQDPAPILIVQPTEKMGEAFSKDRVAPMIRDTAVLREVFSTAGAKSSGNTLLHKTFPGGHVTIAGANSPASLASRPVRICLLDECDRFPASSGAEGDPTNLAFKRTTAFWNARHVMISTPTVEGLSRIDAAFKESDQRFFMVPCPHCADRFRLVWELVKWDTIDGKPSADVWVVCPTCGGVINEADKPAMVQAGEWEATEPFNGTAGFHISELYSPFRTWKQVRDKFLEDKKSPERLRTWVNTTLGETWSEDESAVDVVGLASRREPYSKLPPEALILCCGIDVQDDRLEIEVVGFGQGLESWGIDYRVIPGDPGKTELWTRLSEMLSETWTRTDGVALHIVAAGIDSGGHYTTQVYDFAKANPGRVFALKGMAGAGRPLVDKPRRSNQRRVALYTVGVDMVKELFFFSQLKTAVPGPGYCHFPASYDAEWFKQLGNERPAIRHKAGNAYRVWIARGRNEALDCRVYALAAVTILRPNFDAIERRQQPDEPEPEPIPITPASNPRRRRVAQRRGGFVNNWK